MHWSFLVSRQDRLHGLLLTCMLWAVEFKVLHTPTRKHLCTFILLQPGWGVVCVSGATVAGSFDACWVCEGAHWPVWNEFHFSWTGCLPVTGVGLGKMCDGFARVCQRTTNSSVSLATSTEEESVCSWITLLMLVCRSDRNYSIATKSFHCSMVVTSAPSIHKSKNWSMWQGSYTEVSFWSFTASQNHILANSGFMAKWVCTSCSNWAKSCASESCSSARTSRSRPHANGYGIFCHWNLVISICFLSFSFCSV